MKSGKSTCFRNILTLAIFLVMQGCASIKPPVTQDEAAAFSAELANAATFQAEPVTKPIDVHDAIARAIKYNADIRVRELEIAVAEADARVQNASSLPIVVAESTYYKHDANRASYTGASDQLGLSNGLGMSWNILDFGLSCVRAGQAVDKASYRTEELRKAVLRIAEETRAVYWRAVTLERLDRRVAAIDNEVRAAFRAADAAAKDPALDPVPALTVSRDILNAQREINGLRSGLAGSLEQLKQLINVPTTQPIVLRDTREASRLNVRLLAPGEASRIAMENRSEIRQVMYQLRISEDEINAQILQSLPSIGMQSGLTNASLTALAGTSWIGWTAKSAWQLMNLLRLPVSIDAIDSQKDLLRQQGIAMAVSISMQVHISSVQFSMQQQALRDSERLLRVQRQLEHHEAASALVGQASGQSLTREKIATVLAEARRSLAYADVQSAYGTYLTSLGVDFLDMSSIHDRSVDDLASELRASQRTDPIAKRLAPAAAPLQIKAEVAKT